MAEMMNQADMKPGAKKKLTPEEMKAAMAAKKKKAGAKKPAKGSVKPFDKPPVTDETKEIEEGVEEAHTKEYVPYGILSFDDWDAYEQAEDAADAIREDTSIFMQLVWNNINSCDVPDKQKALLSLVKAYATRLGEDATNPPEDDDDEDKEMNEPPSFLLVKEATGQYRWLAIYSNHFRDDDHPAEIISTKSHRTFTDMAMKGTVPMPELWQWHIPGSRWGVTDSLYFGDDGFALATGVVDKGKEKVAEAMMATKEAILVSHGMPNKYIIRDVNDPTVINFHVTKEISTLPGHRAANKLTGFNLLTKETDMVVDQARQDWLLAHGYDATEVKAIVDSLATKAVEEGRQSKEATPATEPVAETPKTETPATLEAKGEPEAKKEAATPVATEGFNLKELVEAMAGVVKPLVDKVTVLEKQVTTMQAAQSGVTAAVVEKAKTMTDETPSWSLKELLEMSVFGADARVPGNTKLASDAPVEKEAAVPTGLITGIPFIDALMANQIAK